MVAVVSPHALPSGGSRPPLRQRTGCCLRSAKEANDGRSTVLGQRKQHADAGPQPRHPGLWRQLVLVSEQQPADPDQRFLAGHADAPGQRQERRRAARSRRRDTAAVGRLPRDDARLPDDPLRAAECRWQRFRRHRALPFAAAARLFGCHHRRRVLQSGRPRHSASSASRTRCCARSPPITSA